MKVSSLITPIVHLFGPIALLFALSSCAGVVKVSPVACQNQGYWHHPKTNEEFISFSASERFLLSPWWGDDVVIRPEKIIENAGISCKDMTSYSVHLEEDALSVFGSLFFLPTVKVTISGEYQELAERDPEDEFF